MGHILFSHSREIRAWLKLFSSRNTFSPRDIERKNAEAELILAHRGWSRTAISGAVHASWNGLELGRKSAACVYEQYRLRFAVLSLILPYLRSLRLRFYHVTIVSRKWRQPRNKVTECNAAATRRKAKAGVERLRRIGLRPVVWGMVELSGGIDLARKFSWEPHIHLIIGGASKKQIREAFRVRTTKDERGRLKPVNIKAIDETLGRCLNYGCKFKPELRKMYIGKNGRPNRGKDLLKGRDLIRWTAWMALQPITNMIIHFGIPNTIIQEVLHAEMAELVSEMT